MHSFPLHATSLHLDWVLVVVAAWLLIGLAGVALVLVAIDRYAPEWTTVYIIIVILGLVLSHAGCFAAFAQSISDLRSQ